MSPNYGQNECNEEENRNRRIFYSAATLDCIFQLQNVFEEELQ